MGGEGVMNPFKKIRLAFVLCLFISLSLLVIEMFPKFDTIKASYHSITNSTDIRQYQRHVETSVPTPETASEKGGGILAAAGGGFYEHVFLSKVEQVLGKLPANSAYRDVLIRVVDRAKLRGSKWKDSDKESLHDSQFLNYMKCPRSVRARMLSNPYTQRRFTPETPILSWNEHYSHEEYERLKDYHGIYGWKGLNETDVEVALGNLNSSRNRYLFDDRLINGRLPRNDRCIRCAVIGNGGILNGSKQGKAIDNNDYVFRVNTALTRGFEEDVGRRTSFYCFGMVTLSNTLAGGRKKNFTRLPSDEGIRYVFFADNVWAYTYLGSVLQGKKDPGSRRRYRPRFPKQLQAEDVKLVHPDFGRYLKFSWVNSTRRNKPVHRPTTGGIMLLLALHTCDEVNVYGFAGSYQKFSEHYYDKTFAKHRNFANHDNKAENKLWIELHKRGIINLYTRD